MIVIDDILEVGARIGVTDLTDLEINQILDEHEAYQNDDPGGTWEEFKCIECGYENNADINAAINIKQRVSSTVLRDKLLKQTKIGNGSFKPKVLKRDKVKEISLSFRYRPKMVMEVSPMSRFEYF